jgi:hypothetical protein
MKFNPIEKRLSERLGDRTSAAVLKAETTRSRREAVAVTATLTLLSFAAATQATAGCAEGLMRHAMPMLAANSSDFVPPVYRPGTLGTALTPVGDSGGEASIVGLWEFKFAGFLNDFGTQAFHAGGTETMFSAGVDPATGDVCQGVWRKVGHSTYTLNHVAMGWTAPGAEYGVLIHFHMLIKVAPSGDSYTGNYDVSLYSATPQDPFDESAGPFVSGSGTLNATRVKAD